MKSLFPTLPILLLSCLLGMPAQAKPRDVWAEYTIATIHRLGEDPRVTAFNAGVAKAIPPLEEEYHLDITYLTRGPREGTIAEQQKYVRELYGEGVRGFLVHSATKQDRVPLENSPEAQFFSYLGLLSRVNAPHVAFVQPMAATAETSATVTIDEATSGRIAAEALIRTLGRFERNVAILAGPADESVMQARLQAAQKAISDSSKADLFGIYHTEPNVDAALQTLRAAMAADQNKAIDAWLFLGPWPLMHPQPLPYDATKIKTVAVEALPVSLPFLARGEVQAIVALPYYDLGEISATLLIQTMHLKEAPKPARVVLQPHLVDQTNWQELFRDWQAWLR